MAEQLKQYATYMWQEQKRHPFYRIQTNDCKIARKLKKRKYCHLVVYGINLPIWVFRIKYSSPKKALLGLSNLTGADAEKVANSGVFVAYTRPYMDITNDDRVQL